MLVTVNRGFNGGATGNPALMHDTDGVFPDDVPVADAVDQQRPTFDSPDEPDTTSWQDATEVPLEASTSDWREQRETVAIDPELEEIEEPEHWE